MVECECGNDCQKCEGCSLPMCECECDENETDQEEKEDW